MSFGITELKAHSLAGAIRHKVLMNMLFPPRRRMRSMRVRRFRLPDAVMLVIR
jgi:hypothetical protein